MAGMAVTSNIEGTSSSANAAAWTAVAIALITALLICNVASGGPIVI